MAKTKPKKKQDPPGMKLIEDVIREGLSEDLDDDFDMEDDDFGDDADDFDISDGDSFDISASAEGEDDEPEEWEYDPKKPTKSHKRKKLRIEEEVDTEMSEVLRTFKKSARKEKELMEMATDSEFWLCICFKTRDHKDEFLSKSGLEVFGDKYVDGHKFARAVGVNLETPIPKKLPPFRKDKDFASLAE